MQNTCFRCNTSHVVLAAHSPDNSFMGFVVDNFINSSSDTSAALADKPRRDQALVYGKAEYMWEVRHSKERHLGLVESCTCRDCRRRHVRDPLPLGLGSPPDAESVHKVLVPFVKDGSVLCRKKRNAAHKDGSARGSSAA